LKDSVKETLGFPGRGIKTGLIEIMAGPALNFFVFIQWERDWQFFLNYGADLMVNILELLMAGKAKGITGFGRRIK
jgi:hypothetical protein